MAIKLFNNVRGRDRLTRDYAKIFLYLISGRKPWTSGYQAYKEMFLDYVLQNQDLLNRFLHNRLLPPRYGLRLDERVIEYPWVIARLGVTEQLLLDAGSCLNYQYIIKLAQLRSRPIVIYNLSRETLLDPGNVSYIYGDLRHTSFKDECFHEIVCISTLEHIGMNNTFLYSANPRFNESKRDDYQEVIGEFKRMLIPNGRLYITVPYGRHENLGWLQQFNNRNIETILEVFNGSASCVVYYKYDNHGWQIANADACTDCVYFDIHNRSTYEPDYVAAARCVACIELIK